MKDFMNFHWVLPFGNEGRGTKVYLWPFMGLAVFILLTLVHYGITS